MFEIASPTETRKFRPDYLGKPKREIESRWVLNPVPEHQAEATVDTVVVTLTVRHDPDSKVFRSSLTWEKVAPPEPNSPFTVTTWGSDHAYAVVGRNKVERYSKKALEAEHADILHYVTSNPDTFGFVFEEAAQAVPVPQEV